MLKKRKPRITRREVKAERVGTGHYGKYAFGIFYEPGTIHIEQQTTRIPKVILHRGKNLSLYKRKMRRAGALAEIKKLKAKGIHAVNYQVKRGRLVVDNAIYTE